MCQICDNTKPSSSPVLATKHMDPVRDASEIQAISARSAAAYDTWETDCSKRHPTLEESHRHG